MEAWVETADGWESGPFSIVRASRGGWSLLRSGKALGHYGRASTARSAARRHHLARSSRRAIALRVGAAVAASLLAVLVVAFRMEAHPARAEAELLAARIDAAHAAAVGGAPIDTVGGEGLAAAEVPIPRADPVLMLTGEAGGTCYAFYWNDLRGPVARALVAGLPCEPHASAATSAHNVYHRQTPAISGHLPRGGSVFDWDVVLPPPERIRPWAIPLGVGLAAVVLLLLVDASRIGLGASPGRLGRAMPAG